MKLRCVVPAALLACLAVLVLVAAPVAGAAKPHKTTVVVSLKFPAFHGTLKSDDDGCLGGRRVSLYRKHAGKAKKLGTDRSNANGKWEIRVGKNLSSGEYIATVAKKGECRGGRSQPAVID